MNCSVFIPQRFIPTARLREFLKGLGVERMLNHVDIFAVKHGQLGTRLFFKDEASIIESLLKRQESEE